MHIINYRRRSKAVFLLLLVFLFCCIGRLFFIQLFRSRYLAGIAEKQHNLFVELEPRRGTIYDAYGKPLAFNIAADSLYASCNEIPDKQKEFIIGELSRILNLDAKYLRDKLYRRKSFVWIARKIAPAQAEAVRRLNVKGLDFIKESKRSYPNGYLAGHVLGFAGLDNTGLDGTELRYDKYLKGQSGWALFLRDARQKKLDLSKKAASPVDGYDLVLTIDAVIQYIAERELEKAVKTYHPKGASIIVMDPHTGEILALANRPTFELNDYGFTDADTRRNRAIADLFEPGSVFKIVTLAAALEENKFREEDRIFCENGSYRVANHLLHDHTSHGWLTFREVIEQSSNIGTTKVAQGLGNNLLYRYVRSFGFGAKTGVDMPGEICGMLKEPASWSKTSIGAIPIGQEVGVTELQMASAISVIANGGQLMKPYIVSEVRDKYGQLIKKYSPQMIRKVISVDTARRATKILTGVMENGTGRMAKLEDFSAAGKTGTAQKLEPNGAYSHSKFVASFIGFAPAEDPLITIAVMLDEPRPTYYGGVVAAPVFKHVATDVLSYLRASPNRSGAVSHE